MSRIVEMVPWQNSRQLAGESTRSTSFFMPSKEVSGRKVPFRYSIGGSSGWAHIFMPYFSATGQRFSRKYLSRAQCCSGVVGGNTSTALRRSISVLNQNRRDGSGEWSTFASSNILMEEAPRPCELLTSAK